MGEREGGRGAREGGRLFLEAKWRTNRHGKGEREGGEAIAFVRSLARSLSSRVLLPPPLPLLSRPPSSSEED